jgi:CubicO group peptidase (beta-lactamase class C family)
MVTRRLCFVALLMSLPASAGSVPPPLTFRLEPEATQPATAQKPATWQRDVDRVFAAYDRRDSPGCAAAVFKDDKIAYERGYGIADLEHEVPITPATVFYAGSVSKQFTAFAAALAIQQGRLGLDDPIRKHLPELPAYADAVTVRHLVHHTSGLRDFYTLLSIAGRRQDALFDNVSILRLTARQTALNFAPGADYLYSNTGYALLATIVGRATGMSFSQFAEEQIFKPLGMSASHFGDDASRLVQRRAYGYTWGSRGEPRLDTPGGERVGAGGLFTTVRDLLKWDQNFYTGKVGGKGLIEQVQMAGVLNSGKPLSYAWGLQIGSYRGLKVVEHSGSLGGYRAHLARYPERHVGIAVLCNLGVIVPGSLGQQIADAVIGRGFPQPKPTGVEGSAVGPPLHRASPPSWRAEDVAGVYTSDELEATFTVTARAGQLLLQRGDDADAQPLTMAQDGNYRLRNIVIRFVFSGGKIDALLVDAGRVRDIRFKRMSNAP